MTPVRLAKATDKLPGRICPLVDGLRLAMDQYNPEQWKQRRYEAKRGQYDTFDEDAIPEGVTFEVEHVYDEDADLSYLGTWSDRWEPGAIDHKRRQGYGHCYQWFIPEADPDDIRGFLSARGYSRGVAAYEAQVAPYRDYYRMADYGNGWNMIGVVVTMYVDSPTGFAKHNEVESRSLWGIESDMGDYIEEVERDLKYELLGELPDILSDMQRGIAVDLEQLQRIAESIR